MCTSGAHRVKTLGVGSHVENLKENQLANAIRDATTNPETIKRAKDLGKKLKDVRISEIHPKPSIDEFFS